jgi:hypothetical protein
MRADNVRNRRASSKGSGRSSKGKSSKPRRRRSSGKVFKQGGVKMLRVEGYVRKLGKLPPRTKAGRFTKRGQGSLF